MNKIAQNIGKENAKIAAERFILSRFPNADITFEGIGLKTKGTRQIYDVAGHCYCRLVNWPNSVGIKIRYKIQVDASSEDIITCDITEHILSS